jgi:hypothetical protein
VPAAVLGRSKSGVSSLPVIVAVFGGENAVELGIKARAKLIASSTVFGGAASASAGAGASLGASAAAESAGSPSQLFVAQSELLAHTIVSGAVTVD